VTSAAAPTVCGSVLGGVVVAWRGDDGFIWSTKSIDGLSWSAMRRINDWKSDDAPSISRYRHGFMAFFREGSAVKSAYSGDGIRWAQLRELPGVSTNGAVAATPDQTGSRLYIAWQDGGQLYYTRDGVSAAGEPIKTAAAQPHNDPVSAPPKQPAGGAPAGSKATASDADKPAEPQPAEPQPAEPQSAEPQSAEPQSAEPQSAESKSAEAAKPAQLSPEHFQPLIADAIKQVAKDDPDSGNPQDFLDKLGEKADVQSAPEAVKAAHEFYYQNVEKADFGSVTLYTVKLGDASVYAVNTRTDGDIGWLEIYSLTGDGIAFAEARPSELKFAGKSNLRAYFD
jgi:hypothetical protein